MIHPLQNYLNLIEGDQLKIVISEFYDYLEIYNSFDPNLFEDNRLVWNETLQSYNIENITSGYVVQTHNLDQHLLDLISEYEAQFKIMVRQELISASDDKTIWWCKILQKEISILLEQAKDLKNGVHLVKSLADLDDFLSEYTNGTFISYKIDKIDSKLKWYGNINTLATLFYDLTNPDGKLKISYIKSERQKISNLLSNSFLDNNGDEIKADTINRSLNRNPADTKKAKDRLTISDRQ